MPVELYRKKSKNKNYNSDYSMKELIFKINGLVYKLDKLLDRLPK